MAKKSMKKLALVVSLIMLLSIVLLGCGNDTEKEPEVKSEPVEINISAAASLTDALNEIQVEFEKESDNTLVFNFGSSGALQKQIQEGAPCDLYISASKKHMDVLEDEGKIVPDTRKDLLGNTLTLIASSEKADVIKDYSALTSSDVESISIGTPESVPAGNYAKESFETLNIWDQIQSKLVFAKDVRQVLEYVDSGNTDCGLVYHSDAMLLKTGKIVYDMPEDSHSPIVYPIAITTDAKQAEAAKEFYDFLENDTSTSIFEKYGFTVK